MKLYEALGIASGDVVAFAGAGGKSSAILDIAAELKENGLAALVAPTTKMFIEEAEQVGPIITSEDFAELREQVERAVADSGVVVVGSALISKDRIGGIEPGWADSLKTLADVVLVEADGARRRLIKGTAEYEPVLPGSTTLVVAVGNVHALGEPVDEEHVHRPEIFSEITGVGAGHTITADAFARALVLGSLGKTPEGARKAVILTGVEPGLIMSDASLIARSIWSLGVQNVILSSLPDERPGHVWMP